MRTAKMSSQQPTTEAITQPAEAGLFHRVVLIAWIVFMNGCLFHRIAQIERVVENLAVAAQSDARRLPEPFKHELLQVVRGKKIAHEIELDLIRSLRPELNVEGTNKKHCTL